MRVIIDGMDGTGKTTIAKMLSEKHGLEYVHFPTKPVPEDLDDKRKFNFFMEDFKKWFENNGYKANIILDRSFVSTMLYQSDWVAKEMGVDIEGAMWLIYKAVENKIGKYLSFNKILLFTADPKVAVKRITGRSGRTDQYETVEKLTKVLDNIFVCAGLLHDLGYNVEVIDTTKTSVDKLFLIVEKSLSL